MTDHPTTLHAANLAVGTELPPLSRPDQGFEQWNRYAAVNDEFVGIHMNDEFGRAAGYPSAFGMGNLSTSYLHILLREWAGQDARIVSVALQFRAPLLRGADVTARAVVTGVRPEGDEVFVDLEVWTENQKGERIAPGTAVVAFPLPRP